MKSLKLSALALVGVLSATSAFAGNADYSGDRFYARSVDNPIVLAAKVTANQSAFAATYPTNTDSVLAESPAERDQWIGHRGGNQ